jgi:tRNA A-37 threonylcarbamoyl transferase component Bud32
MKVVINPKYKFLDSFIRNIPTVFEKEGELIYEARNKLKSYDIQGVKIIVKSYKKPHFINRIAYTIIRPSKAKRAYEYAFKLLDKGIQTPEPIAYIEINKNGLLETSYYISIFEKDYNYIRSYMSNHAKDDNLLLELAKFICLLHEKGILFLDMSPGNILYKKNNDLYDFCLVDINRMKFMKSIPLSRRYKSFKRLSNNTEILTIVAKEYAVCAKLDEKEALLKIKKANTAFLNK